MRILILLLLVGTARADATIAARMLAEADRYSPEVMLAAAERCEEKVCRELRARALDRRSAWVAARARLEAKYAGVAEERREILIESDDKLLYGPHGLVADRRKAPVLFRVDATDDGYRVTRFEFAGDHLVHASFVTYAERPDAVAFR